MIWQCVGNLMIIPKSHIVQEHRKGEVPAGPTQDFLKIGTVLFQVATSPMSCTRFLCLLWIMKSAKKCSPVRGTRRRCESHFSVPVMTKEKKTLVR